MTLRFFTHDGLELPAVTADQMREIDRIAIEETGPNLWQMMENAGRNLALLAMDLLGAGWRRAGIVVLAGNGGNGGGGICAARHLANHGARVRLCLTDPNRLGEVPAAQRKIFQLTAGEEIRFEALQGSRPDLVIDAVIGYGITGAPRGRAAEVIAWANAAGTSILALDVPSGLDATTGEAPGPVIAPEWTMTLALPKTGLRPDRSGATFLADIGIPREVYRRAGIDSVPLLDGRYVMAIRSAK
jgi:NAD(P)H-hydrate epimerase